MATSQLGAAARTARADALVTAVGASPSIKFFSQALPANCAAADPGTPIATGTLPATPLSNASGVVSKSGTWNFTGTATAAAGTAMACYRIYNGATCVLQGDVTHTSGSGAMKVNNVSIAENQAGEVTSFTWTEPNA